MNGLRAGSLILASSLVLVFAAGCGSSSTTWGTVNGHQITQSQVETRVGVIKVLSPSSASQFKQRTAWVNETQELASEYLVMQAAQKAKFTVTSKALQSSQTQFNEYLTETLGSKSALDKTLKKDGITQADINAYVKTASILQGYLTKVVKVPTVTPSQVATFYYANISQFQNPAQYDLRHILVKTKAQAESILKQLQAGASFTALAQKYSTDTATASKGGDLGYAPLSNYVTQFADAAKLLTKVGQLSPVVHSQYGYHIIELLGIKKATTQPLSDVQSEIQSYLEQQNQQQAQQTYVDSLRSKAKISTSVPKQVP